MLAAERGSVAALAIAAALFAPPGEAAPEEELARLSQKAELMRQSLDDLDAQIRALENEVAKSRGPATPPSQVPSAAATKRNGTQTGSTAYLLQRNWSEIHTGISKDRVDVLLGQPERAMRINGDLVWYYIYPGLGRGSVFFNEQGKVSSAQPPRVGWIW